jgi:hypothetical protein
MLPASQSISIHVPFRLRKVGGRKQVVLPDGATAPANHPRPDGALIKALARAFRWKRMLESGEFATIADLAEREGIAPSYMTRVMRMTLLAPEIVEAILDGRQGPGMTPARLMEPFPMGWTGQHTQRDQRGPNENANFADSSRSRTAEADVGRVMRS